MNLVEIIEATENDNLYDYIALNCYKMSRSELKDILLEVIYIYWKAKNQVAELSSERAEELKHQLIENLKSRLEY